LAEQVHEGAFLGVGTGVGGLEALVQPPLVADTDALVVPAGGVRPDLVQWTAAVYLAVAGDVEMIADVGESPGLVGGPKGFHREITVVTSGAAMDYKEAHLPVILVKTRGYHTPQAVKPNVPAKAVATAMITLMITPHTDFFFSCSIL
jgi:hypothetical protein